MQPKTTVTYIRFRKGFGLVEIVVAVGILASVLAILYSAAILSYKTANRASRRIQAELLLTREAELMRAYRDRGGRTDKLGKNNELYCMRMLTSSVPADKPYTNNQGDRTCFPFDLPNDMDYKITFQQAKAYHDTNGALTSAQTGNEATYAKYFTVTATWDATRTESLNFFLTDYNRTIEGGNDEYESDE